ncbi:hypothetical protein C8J57DRAFT_1234865 [Mycena rebaudengoi]|nr:hypothetical protein C8J57DRAFT_1234865 [Mycena rebaudengoi]
MELPRASSVYSKENFASARVHHQQNLRVGRSNTNSIKDLLDPSCCAVRDPKFYELDSGKMGRRFHRPEHAERHGNAQSDQLVVKASSAAPLSSLLLIPTMERADCPAAIDVFQRNLPR